MPRLRLQAALFDKERNGRLAWDRLSSTGMLTRWRSALRRALSRGSAQGSQSFASAAPGPGCRDPQPTDIGQCLMQQAAEAGPSATLGEAKQQQHLARSVKVPANRRTSLLQL